MTHRIDVDALYAGFCAAIPNGVAPAAHSVGPLLLGAPSRSQLSEYFEHPFILEAPDFIAESLPTPSPRAIRDATLAHLLTVLRSAAELRAARSEPALRGGLEPILAELRAARDRVIANLSPIGLDAFEIAEQRASRALDDIQRVFAGGEGANLSDYLLLTREIMAPRVQACRLLATMAGQSDERLLLLERALECVWVARETERDAEGWRRGWRAASGWVVCLARSARGRASADQERSTEPDLIARMVHESGVLDSMRACAARLWDAAAHRAAQLGASRLALWTKQRGQACGTPAAQGSALCLIPTGSGGA